jgi:hypothetical protein
MSEKPKGFYTQPSFWLGLIATAVAWFFAAWAMTQ